MDPSLLERGLVGDLSSDDNLTLCHGCILSCVEKVRYYKNPVKSKSRLHIFVGQETVLANLTFFNKISSAKVEEEEDNRLTNGSREYCTFERTAKYQYIDEFSSDTSK
ncbi:unnamed protein product [Trichobilharzia regenti]|nr:unnamed protein product [Trichobilharzia regenti]